MKKRTRVLEHLTDQELTSKGVECLVEEYFLERSTVRGEFYKRGLKPPQKEMPHISVTIQDLKETPVTQLAKREKTTEKIIHKFVYQTHGIKQEEIYKMYQAHQKEKRRIDLLSDDEIRKPHVYLIKMYGTTGQEIREERLKRGLTLKENKFMLSHVSDDELLNTPIKQLQERYCVSYDTVSRERRARKFKKDTSFKKRSLNILKDVNDDELFGSTENALAEKYGVSKSTVYNEKKRRRDDGRV